MRFHSYEMWINSTDKFSKQDMRDAVSKANTKFQDGDMLYLIQLEILEERFLWLACDYENMKKYSPSVLNHDSFEVESNPRGKEQVELRQQVFALYDTKKQILYISDVSRRPFIANYLQHTLQKEITVKAIYSSVDDFCEVVKIIKGLRFKQVDNMITRQNDIFKETISKTGLDVKEVQIKIGFGDTPVKDARSLLEWIHRERDAFERVIVVGVDDNDIEQTFDYSSILKHVELHLNKDENEHYDASEVKSELLKELRNSGNV
ncbi:hypothetical protein [Faecalibacterium prausnitzii]|jgi:hypothetical protein|uniref:Uncharacterized protein n=2 Tax=Bacteria TaxID=2 RepID=A0A2A7AAR8_9FIRM|nr:hypothetical protein [Faecalibacterium prausnitzii]PDX76123.1 hypothetical protein CGS56_05450 [Faecalibacterium prausnitzii]